MIKNTVSVYQEEAVARFRESMMEYLSDVQSDTTVEEFITDLEIFNRDLKSINSQQASISLPAFKRLFSQGYTMMMMDPKEFDMLEDLSKNGEDFNVIIFRQDGEPVGLVSKEFLNW